MGVRHGDPPGVVRIGCLGERAWKVVGGVAESIGGVAEDAPVMEVAAGKAWKLCCEFVNMLTTQK